jgi:hypothetical protein
MRHECGQNLTALNRDDWWEFLTYLKYWLAGLFVLVEGINKLEIRDARIQKLFNAQIGLLKKMRHETYHFVVSPAAIDETILRSDGLNWAEELQDAIGEHVREVAMRRADVERFWKIRKKKSD